MACRVFPVLGRDPENGTGLITLRRPVGSTWPAIAALRFAFWGRSGVVLRCRRTGSCPRQRQRRGAWPNPRNEL